KPGMILSDEPGFYLPGSHGIRLENLLMVQPAPDGIAGKKFLAFETLTLAPFARRLILPDLLDPSARAWLDAYHAQVRETVAPALPPEDRAWLEAETEPLGRG
ncbi:MAG TPA: M24 family metallopeptidase C-terminal domain-containing protein, partial [Acetobacteraceae bacterium]|nr:M24 family metallopeptidase C-terminal domain-containing protein [Acetobacteraceae bacterium]